MTCTEEISLEAIKSDVELYRLWIPDLKPSGKGYVAHCPLHEDRNPSFKINNVGGAWLWNCFAGCGGGSIVDLAIRLLDCDAAGAIRQLKERAAGQPQAVAPLPPPPERQRREFEGTEEQVEEFEHSLAARGETEEPGLSLRKWGINLFVVGLN